MPESTVTYGRSVDDVVEGEMGCLYSVALALHDLKQALYVVGEEFRYDEDNPVAAEMTRRADELSDYVTDLSLTNDGVLTDNRECGRCSGGGKTAGEDPCIECGGRGYVNAEEADG